MKRTLFLSGILILSVGSWTPNSTLAQPAERDREAKPGPHAADAHVGKADSGGQPAKARPFEQSRAVPWVSGQGVISRLRELQQAMKDELQLSDDQLKNTDKLFKDHLERLQEKAASEGAEGAEAVDIEELKSIREQMMEARKAGDIGTARKLRGQMMERARKRRAYPSGESTSRFIKEVADQLEKGQLEAFQTLVKRFGFAKRERPQPNRLHALFRAVRDPELGLSTEQQRTIHEIVRDTLMAQRPRGGARPEMDKVADAVRVKIAEHLTPKQNAKLDTLLSAAEAGGGKAGPARPTVRGESPSVSPAKRKAGTGEQVP